MTVALPGTAPLKAQKPPKLDFGIQVVPRSNMPRPEIRTGHFYIILKKLKGKT